MPECRVKDNGNCAVPDADGHAVQHVGPWATDKHHYLKQYIDATVTTRKKFITYNPRSPGSLGGAAFVDLFAGPGRARIGDDGPVVNGSPLLALAHQQAPFTHVLLCDSDPENARALRARTASDDRATAFEGDCNERIGEIIAAIPEHGLNVALVDPFGVTPLAHETIRRLMEVKRLDLILHFPTSDLKRNIRQYPERINRFLGGSEWREVADNPGNVIKLVTFLRNRLGLPEAREDAIRTVPIKAQGHTLYHLVFAAKSPLAIKIWNSITRTAPDGQRALF